MQFSQLSNQNDVIDERNEEATSSKSTPSIHKRPTQVLFPMESSQETSDLEEDSACNSSGGDEEEGANE